MQKAWLNDNKVGYGSPADWHRRCGVEKIEIVKGDRGQPILNLHGNAKVIADALRWREWSLSMSHAHEHAIAMFVATDLKIGD